MRAPLPATAARLIALGPPIAYCGLLWWLSSRPNPGLEGGTDSYAHLVAYGVLGALWVRGLWLTTDRSPPWVYGVSVLLSAAYGVVDELHQAFRPDRTPSLSDQAANVAGSALGAALMLGVYLSTRRVAQAVKRRRGGAPPDRG